MARTLVELAAVAAAAGDLRRAARIHAASTAAMEEMGAARRRDDQFDVRALAPMHGAVDRGELAAEWAAGLQTTLEAAVEEALASLGVRRPPEGVEPAHGRSRPDRERK